jgi:hypothetical protein
LALERPTSKKYYIVHTPFQYFMKSETNILEKNEQSVRSVSKHTYASKESIEGKRNANITEKYRNTTK